MRLIFRSNYLSVFVSFLWRNSDTTKTMYTRPGRRKIQAVWKVFPHWFRVLMVGLDHCEPSSGVLVALHWGPACLRRGGPPTDAAVCSPHKCDLTPAFIVGLNQPACPAVWCAPPLRGRGRATRCWDAETSPSSAPEDADYFRQIISGRSRHSAFVPAMPSSSRSFRISIH